MRFRGHLLSTGHHKYSGVVDTPIPAMSYSVELTLMSAFSNPPLDGDVICERPLIQYTCSKLQATYLYLSSYLGLIFRQS